MNVQSGFATFDVLDHTHVIASDALTNIRTYLRNRHDAARQIFRILLDDLSNDDLLKNAKERSLQFIGQDPTVFREPTPVVISESELTNEVDLWLPSAEKETFLEWMPQISQYPADRLAMRPLFDNLVAIYEDQSIFVDEYARLLGSLLLSRFKTATEADSLSRLPSGHRYDVLSHKRDVQQLKSFFGQKLFRDCEVMLNDFEESEGYYQHFSQSTSHMSHSPTFFTSAAALNSPSSLVSTSSPHTFLPIVMSREYWPSCISKRKDRPNQNVFSPTQRIRRARPAQHVKAARTTQHSYELALASNTGVLMQSPDKENLTMMTGHSLRSLSALPNEFVFLDGVAVPDSIAAHFDSFEDHFTQHNPHRLLEWNAEQTMVTLETEVRGRPRSFTVPLPFASVLFLFANEEEELGSGIFSSPANPSLSIDSIVQSSGLSEKDARRAVSFWCSHGVLSDRGGIVSPNESNNRPAHAKHNNATDEPVFSSAAFEEGMVAGTLIGPIQRSSSDSSFVGEREPVSEWGMNTPQSFTQLASPLEMMSVQKTLHTPLQVSLPVSAVMRPMGFSPSDNDDTLSKAQVTPLMSVRRPRPTTRPHTQRIAKTIESPSFSSHLGRSLPTPSPQQPSPSLNSLFSEQFNVLMTSVSERQDGTVVPSNDDGKGRLSTLYESHFRKSTNSESNFSFLEDDGVRREEEVETIQWEVFDPLVKSVLATFKSLSLSELHRILTKFAAPAKYDQKVRTPDVLAQYLAPRVISGEFSYANGLYSINVNS
ncbi:hypothetical protein BLNAU_8848 [Blattamonas nauphoetae]|uniref:Cullin family profile domain-containing protein n=1 Tax=Blattamonas nauphoetae TaxID=2049346 RepID=A0ABQ9XXV1_9EUKA|nr:hypothetical protein BLNAU_8848 [Blattamonas nauphoetae]